MIATYIHTSFAPLSLLNARNSFQKSEIKLHNRVTFSFDILLLIESYFKRRPLGLSLIREDEWDG